MTHREMVCLTPRHAVSWTREQMEAHLTLCGWEPFNAGMAGALRDNTVVYAFNRAGPSPEVEVKYDTLAGMNLLGQAKWGAPGKTKADARRVSMWYMSDKYFWPLAHACINPTESR